MLLLLLSAITDGIYRKIPNLFFVVGLLLGLYWNFNNQGTSVIWFLTRIIAINIIFYPLFRCRMIGAGDIKLMSLLCGYLGWSHGWLVIFFGFIVGAFYSLYKLCRLNVFYKRLYCLFSFLSYTYQTKQITHYYDYKRDGHSVTVPLGVCLFIGAVIDLLRLLWGGVL